MLYLRAFRKRERILDVDPKVANGALDFFVAEQDLHGAPVARPMSPAPVRCSRCRR